MDISVVIPAYNEEDNVKPLYSALKTILEHTVSIDDSEIIFVDDGSTDSTYDKLSSLGDDRVRVIKLEKNTGLSNALRVGFEAARNEIIVTMDADGQSDPSDIPDMLKKITEGYDCVCGWRYDRKDPFIKRISSKIANSIRRFVIGDNFRDITCPLKVFKKECIKNIDFFEGIHRFYPFLIRMEGYRVLECKVKHHPRRFGKSKYGVMNRVFKSTSGLIYVKFTLCRQNKKDRG